MNEQLKKRLLSLAWRAGAMGVIAILAFISSNIATFDLPQWVVVGLGLGLGEITKFLNNFLIKSEVSI